MRGLQNESLHTGVKPDKTEQQEKAIAKLEKALMERLKSYDLEGYACACMCVRMTIPVKEDERRGWSMVPVHSRVVARALHLRQHRGCHFQPASRLFCFCCRAIQMPSKGVSFENVCV